MYHDDRQFDAFLPRLEKALQIAVASSSVSARSAKGMFLH